MSLSRREFLGLGLMGAAATLLPFPFDVKKPFPNIEIPTSGAGLHVVDIWEGVKYYSGQPLIDFYEDKHCTMSKDFKTKQPKQVDNTVKSTILEYNEKRGGDYYRQVRQVQYVGCRSYDMQKGCKKLAEILTELQQSSGLWKYLTKPIALKLVDGSIMFVSYIVLGDNTDLVKTGYPYAFVEGGAAKLIDNQADHLQEIADKQVEESIEKFKKLDFNITGEFSAPV